MNSKKVLALLQTKTGTEENWQLGLQLAQACDLDVLDILKPYEELTKASSIIHLQQLVSISFPSNQLSTIDPILFEFPKLTHLILADNPLQIVPEYLAALQKLISLELYKIHLSTTTYQQLKTLLPDTTISVSEGYLY